MSVEYADGSYSGGNVATEIGENVFNPGRETGGDGAFLGEGVRSGIDSFDKAYINAGGKFSNFGLSDLKKFVTDNKAFITGAGALASAYSGGSGADKKVGYQGVIPSLSASRSMIAAPPTRAQGYRPGAGGIDYGGDVTYALAPGQSPFANLSGTSGSAADANLTKIDTGITGDKSGIKGLPGSAGYEKFIAGGGTPQGYLKIINDYLYANPNITNTQLKAKMAELGVSQVDLQTALGVSNYSDAEKYALTHGMGSSGVNQSINNFLALYPNATFQQKLDAMDKYDISAQDVRDAEALPLQNKAAAIAAGQTPASTKDIMTAFTAAEKNDTDPGAVARMVASSGLSTAQLTKDFGLKQTDLDYLRGQGYLPPGYVEGGEIAMAKGRYLQGGTDGMADEIPAQIGQDQPAALSHGEFVIPADVVSHMGNGNSDAGAKKLYKMMDKIRMARTGNKKQGKKINPDKFMPGGLASSKYVTGGSVKHFQTGGSTIPTGVSGVESNLSNFAGPYVTNMLGQGQAISNMPYQAYLGQLTAGESPLQTGAFNTAAGLTTPKTVGDAAKTAGDIATKAGALSYSPTTFGNQYTVPKAYSPTTSSFDAAQAATYMNPYLKASLDPQLVEARRQSEITQNQNNAQMTRAGAYGGGRQAILNAETQRNLGTNLANITSQGYNTAFTNAQQQFNADQARKMQEAQFGAQQGMSSAQLGAQYGLAGQQAAEQSKQFGQNFGLQGLQTGLQAAQAQGALGGQQNQIGLANLAQQLAAGQQQRGIESEGIAADKAQFEEARANPYKMIQFQQSLLQGLPLAAQSYQGIEPSALTRAAAGATTVNQLLKNLGLA